MPNSPLARYLYWDACVFIDFFDETPNRIAIIMDVMREVREHSNSTIYTSIFTITEVNHLAVEQRRKKLSPDTLRILDNLWGDRNLITLIEFNRTIADLARDLSRQALAFNWSLKPADAIQLASAYWIKQRVKRPLDEIHTYDDRLYKFVPLVDIPICAPYALQSSLPGISQDNQ